MNSRHELSIDGTLFCIYFFVQIAARAHKLYSILVKLKKFCFCKQKLFSFENILRKSLT